MALLERGIASLDMTVSTPTNIKGFISHPPDGLKLYVKYRGDISPGQGQGREETPLGEEPKNIQGTILDARIYGGALRFLIMLQVTKSPDPDDVGKAISIYPTRDLISLYPFRSLSDLVKKKVKKSKIEKLKGYANIHQQLAYLPEDEDGMAGRETIKAKARFEGKKKPELPQLGPSDLAEYYHDDYQGRQYDKSMKKSGQIQDDTGNLHIGDDKLGGRRRRRKRKTKRKSRKSKKRRRKKRKTRRKRKSRRKRRR